MGLRAKEAMFVVWTMRREDARWNRNLPEIERRLAVLRRYNNSFEISARQLAKLARFCHNHKTKQILLTDRAYFWNRTLEQQSNTAVRIERGTI